MKKQIFTRTAIALLIGGFGVSMSAMSDTPKPKNGLIEKVEKVETRVVTVEKVLGIDPTAAADPASSPTNNAFTNLTSKVTELEKDFVSHRDKTIKDVNDINDRLDGVVDSSNNNEARLDKVDTGLNDVNTRVDNLLLNTAMQLGSLKNDVFGKDMVRNENGTYSLKDDPDKAQPERQFNLGTIVKDLDDTNDVLEEVTNTAYNNEARLNEIDDDLDDMDKDIDSNTTRIKANEDQIAKINERHDKVDAEKRSALEKAINHNSDEITTLENQFAVLGAIHNTEEAQIQALADHRARQDVQIHNLDTRLNQLDTRLNRLDKKLKRGLASQAALSGLFQPYTVGKFNATAAVGGYNSQQAVAVGAGYRFNDHVAGKAGVAFAGHGDVSYHAGVNFEW